VALHLLVHHVHATQASGIVSACNGAIQCIQNTSPKHPGESWLGRHILWLPASLGMCCNTNNSSWSGLQSTAGSCL
jgi:hypothetical protein